MVFDVIIVGSGIAGLQCAVNLDPRLKSAIICKDDPSECNTAYAQGGVALSLDDEDIELHIQDTLKTGDGLCKEEAVRLLCQESRGVIEEFIDRGFVFDGDSFGNLHYTKEGAHSRERIIHAGGDRTGRRIEEFLLSKVKAEIFDNLSVSDIAVQNNGSVAIECYDGSGYINFYTSVLVLAYGGIGSIYRYHTNSKTVNGQLCGLCISKGFVTENMEMTQFHPTVYVKNLWARKLLLSEALRGEGAKIVDENGDRFLNFYDKRGELASRDIISRAIYMHKEEKGGDVYLDISGFSREYFAARFPFIYENLTNLGYNVPSSLIPISPAFHYFIGGLKSDLNGLIDGCENIYAIGECASSGVHGANRLASNSLLEGFVFGKRAAVHINQNFKKIEKKDALFDKKIWEKDGDEAVKEMIRDTMWRKAGIVRTKAGLDEALDTLTSLKKSDLGSDVANRLTTAIEIVRSARKRDVPIGVHYIN